MAAAMPRAGPIQGGRRRRRGPRTPARRTTRSRARSEQASRYGMRLTQQATKTGMPGDIGRKTEPQTEQKWTRDERPRAEASRICAFISMPPKVHISCQFASNWNEISAPSLWIWKCKFDAVDVAVYSGGFFSAGPKKRPRALLFLPRPLVRLTLERDLEGAAAVRDRFGRGGAGATPARGPRSRAPRGTRAGDHGARESLSDGHGTRSSGPPAGDAHGAGLCQKPCRGGGLLRSKPSYDGRLSCHDCVAIVRPWWDV